MFQSTPPAEARGDDANITLTPADLGVSIHSPRRSEGRQTPEGDCQSTG